MNGVMAAVLTRVEMAAVFFLKIFDSSRISVDFFIIIAIILYMGKFFIWPINEIRLELL